MIMKNEYLKVFEPDDINRLPVNYQLLRNIKIDASVKEASMKQKFGKCKKYNTTKYRLSFYKPIVQYF